MNVYLSTGQLPKLDLETGPLPEWPSDASQQRRVIRRPRQTKEFLKGPVPMAWLHQACSLSRRVDSGIKAVVPAVCLKRTSGLTLGDELHMSFSLERQAYYRGSIALRISDLVGFDRMPSYVAKISIWEFGARD